MSVKDAEIARETIAEQHRQVRKKLAGALRAEAGLEPNERVVRPLLEKLETIYHSLVESHVKYVNKKGSTMDERIHQEWMDTKQESHDEVVDRALEFLGVIDSTGVPIVVQEDGNRLKEDIETIRLRLEAQLTSLRIAADGELSVEQHKRITEQVEGELEKTENTYLAKIDHASEVIVTERETLQARRVTEERRLIPAFEKIKTDLSRKAPALPGREAAPPRGNDEEEERTRGRRVARMTQLEAPVFSGKAREFKRFEKKFNELVTREYGEQAQLHYLELALPDKVKQRLTLVEKTPEQIWAQLNDVYGDPKTVLREAVGELHELSKKKSNKDFMVLFATTLEETEALLMKDDNQDYLKHPRELALLQDMLPVAEKREFIRRQRNIPGNEYEKFKTFLKDRKYEEMEFSKMGTLNLDSDEEANKCTHCGMRNHLKSECMKLKREQRMKEGEPRRRGSCWTCGEDGHISFDCPQSSSKVKKEGARASINSNTMRTNDCTRCRNAGQLSSACAGCARSGAALSHCLAHCSVYVQEGTIGKTSIVRGGGNCVVCLHPGHTADKCYDMQKENRRCGLDGFGSHHHPTLHGSKDPLVTNCGMVVEGTPSPGRGFGRWRTDRQGGEPIKLGRSSTYTEMGYVSRRDVRTAEGRSEWEDDRRKAEMKSARELLNEPIVQGERAIMILQTVKMIHGWRRVERDLVMFSDSGGGCNLILEDLAENLKLPGQPVTITIGTINGSIERETKLYVVELLTVDRERIMVRAFGIEKISEPILKVDVEGVKYLFPTEIQRRWSSISERPHGRPVELLLGAKNAGLFPKPEAACGDLVVLRSRFGSGWTLFGDHPDVLVETRTSRNMANGATSHLGQVTLVGGAATIRRASGAVVRSEVNLVVQKERVKFEKEVGKVRYPESVAGLESIFKEINDKKGECDFVSNEKKRGEQLYGTADIVELEDGVENSWEDSAVEEDDDRVETTEAVMRINVSKAFLGAEDMGVEAPRRCAKCRGCVQCSLSGQLQTEKEAREYQMIAGGIKLNEETHRFEVEYAFIDDPRKLSDNFGQVVRIAENEEKMLQRERLLDAFNTKFQNMIELGNIGELSQSEMDEWAGPVHYISIQHVVNPRSTTTPLRLVSNSSLVDSKSGLSLNSILAKGPNLLNDLWGVAVRFRENRRALIADVTKAYFSLSTGILEKHVRRLVWRWGDKTKQWQVFAFLVVAMGDRPAAVILEICIKITVAKFGHIDLAAAHCLENDMFVDDLQTGGESEEVERFKGEENPETMQCNGTIPSILAGGGLVLKAIKLSGEPDDETLLKLGGAALGIKYSTERDELSITFRVNVSKKKRGQPTGEDLTRETVGTTGTTILSKRICLGVVNGVYDPHGIAAPVVFRMKAGVKRLFESDLNLDWDTPLPKDLQTYWWELIRMLVEAGQVTYPRPEIKSIQTKPIYRIRILILSLL